MKLRYYFFYLLIFLSACGTDSEDLIESTLSYTTNSVTLKVGEAFESEVPVTEGEGALTYGIADVSSSSFTGISINNSTGVISVIQNNTLTAGITYVIDVSVTSDSGIKVFEGAFSITIIERDLPRNLLYSSDSLMIEIGVDAVSVIPSIDGLTPHKFEILNTTETLGFITINSESGVISISGAESQVGEYELDIKVTNPDGETTFESAFTVIVYSNVNVADGFYFINATSDVVIETPLVPSPVEAPGFSAMNRNGFVQGFIYLTSGSYQMIEVASKTIVNTYGGTHEEITDPQNSECNAAGYHLISAAIDGATFTVPADGLYIVSYDEILGEILYDQIENTSVIGSATPSGWGEDTSLTGSVSATGGTWEAKEILLSDNEMKFRLNCRWAIDRRLDYNSDYDNSNGYSVFTNFGGSVDNLSLGNISSNITINERAIYTVTMHWTPSTGFSASLTKTGEAAPFPTYPEALYLVGAGTSYGWDTPGQNVNAIMHKLAGGSEGIFWKILYLEAGEGFKISAEDWASPNLGESDVDEVDSNGVNLISNSGNMDIAESAMYMVVLNLQNDMTKISIISPEVYGIGDGAFGVWDSGEVTNLFSINNTAKTLISPALQGSGAIRTYVSHAWITDWWNAEFIPDAGNIIYRNDGGDLAVVTGAIGQVITYTFDNNTSSID